MNYEQLLFDCIVAETPIAWSSTNQVRDDALNRLSGYAGHNLQDDSLATFVNTVVSLANGIEDSIEQEIENLHDLIRNTFEDESRSSHLDGIISELRNLGTHFSKIDLDLLRKIADSDWRERHQIENGTE